jgi:uncharacterized tellurite resistance protein B-like protein
MHILLSLLGILTLIAVWYWRLKMISGAAREGYSAAKRLSARRKAGNGPPRIAASGLAGVSDPREAAAIMMLQVARARGTLSELQKAAIRAEMIDHFHFTDAEAADWIARASARVRETLPASAVMARMSDVITRSPGMTSKEYDDLCAMLENVAVAGGDVSEEEAELIQVWRRKAGLN